MRSGLEEIFHFNAYFVPRPFDRQQPLDDDALCDDRFELVVHRVHRVDFLGDEIVDQRFGDLLRRLQRECLRYVRRRANGNRSPLEEIVRLAADRQDLDRLPISLVNRIHRRADDI